MCFSNVSCTAKNRVALEPWPVGVLFISCIVVERYRNALMCTKFFIIVSYIRAVPKFEACGAHRVDTFMFVT